MMCSLDIQQACTWICILYSVLCTCSKWFACGIRLPASYVSLHFSNRFLMILLDEPLWSYDAMVAGKMPSFDASNHHVPCFSLIVGCCSSTFVLVASTLVLKFHFSRCIIIPMSQYPYLEEHRLKKWHQPTHDIENALVNIQDIIPKPQPFSSSIPSSPSLTFEAAKGIPVDQLGLEEAERLCGSRWPIVLMGWRPPWLQSDLAIGKWWFNRDFMGFLWDVPSGNLLHSYGIHGPVEIVSFPIKDGDSIATLITGG